MPKLMKPIQCREKWLVIAAIRFLRTCISMKDEFYHRCGKLLAVKAVQNPVIVCMFWQHVCCLTDSTWLLDNVCTFHVK